jgi:hypothetical protein
MKVGKFMSSTIVKSKPTKDPSVARLTELVDDENKGSSIDSQNAREMNRQHSCQRKK